MRSLMPIETLAATRATARIPARTLALPVWLALLVTAIAARALTFGNPIVHVDEQFYFVTAQRMLDGALPFVDIWDRKPIGLFLIYLPAAALGLPLGIWAYQMMALVSVVLTAMLIHRMACRAGWQAGALPAAMLYIVALNLADGQGGQSPVFYNLLTAAAFALVLPDTPAADNETVRRIKAAVAMLLFAIGLQIKYTMLFEGVFLGLWLLWRELRLGVALPRVLGLGSVLAGVALSPTLIAGLSYAAMGHGDAWFYANFGSILDRRSDPPIELLGGLIEVLLSLAPLLVVSWLSYRVTRTDNAVPPVRGLLFGWLIAAFAGVIAFGGYFTHYALPVMLPAALCCAGYFSMGTQGRRTAAALLALTGVIGTTMVWQKQRGRGTAAEIEALAHAIGQGPECLFVYSGDAMLYGYTGRCAVSRWLFPDHLTRTREDGAIGVDQMAEIDRVFARAPRFVVMKPRFIGERLEVRAHTFAQLQARRYRLKGQYRVGDRMIDLYERQAIPAIRASAGSGARAGTGATPAARTVGAATGRADTAARRRASSIA